MKKLILPMLCVVVLSCANKYKDATNQPSDYMVIPKPLKLEMHTGKFLISDRTTISGAESLINEGNFLAEMLYAATGKKMQFKAGDENGSILLKLDNTIDNDEGYNLNVTYNKIIISGKTAKGIFYGIQTLRQLMPASIEAKDASVSTITIPAVDIQDSPRFAYRGMHLDVARHFFPVDFIKKYIDLLAMHKMNTFHWHLTEDQGWRIEIKKYPKLTEIGSKRYGTIIGHAPGTANDNKVYEGYYTQEQIKEIVAYATQKHITVIPEIELPGHSSAAIAAYPYLSCFPNENTIVSNNMISEAGKALQASGTPKIVQETWGVFDDVFCAGNDETFTFLQDVLDEVLTLFPSTYIHIGGDECPKANWKRCPKCQARMKANKLKDEHELQSYFIGRIETYLNAKGRQIIGWDEILEGGLAPNATVMSWRGTAGGIEAAKQNHDVIMTPGHSCYFDHYQVKSEQEKAEPLAIGGLTTVSDVYNYEPIPTELTPEAHKYILGAQGNVWTEYMATTDYVEYMILPRMTALAEVDWSSVENKNWDDFKTRLQTLAQRFDVLKLNYAKHVFESENTAKTTEN